MTRRDPHGHPLGPRAAAALLTGLALAGAPAPAFAQQGCTTSITVRNTSPQPMVRILLCRPGSERCRQPGQVEPGVPGAGPVPSRGEIRITLTGRVVERIYDATITFGNNRTVNLTRRNLCRATAIVCTSTRRCWVV